MVTYDPLVSNLIRLKPETPLYRIAKLDHVLSDLNSGTFTMPRVMAWEDSHEAAYFRSNLLTANGESVSIEDLGLDWFGQSWTIQPESDAMWRIYNRDFDSVRIETTAGALLSALHTARTVVEPDFEKWSSLSLFLGCVTYHNKKSYEAAMSARFGDLMLGGQAHGLAEMLLTKRAPFDHEREARILYQILEGGNCTLNNAKLYVPGEMKTFQFRNHSKSVPALIRLPFDWKAVTGAMIGPRSPADKVTLIESKLQAAASWISITRSDLYGPPEFSGRF